MYNICIICNLYSPVFISLLLSCILCHGLRSIIFNWIINAYGFSRVRLEAFSDNGGKLQLSLQEIIEWLTTKDEELSEQLPIGGDVGAVQHQHDFHQVVSHKHSYKHNSLWVSGLE